MSNKRHRAEEKETKSCAQQYYLLMNRNYNSNRGRNDGNNDSEPVGLYTDADFAYTHALQFNWNENIDQIVETLCSLRKKHWSQPTREHTETSSSAYSSSSSSSALSSTAPNDIHHWFTTIGCFVERKQALELIEKVGSDVSPLTFDEKRTLHDMWESVFGTSPDDIEGTVQVVCPLLCDQPCSNSLSNPGCCAPFETSLPHP